MNVYIARFNGMFLDGEIILVEETKRKAYNKVKKEIKELELEDKNKDFSMEDVEEIDITKKGFIKVDNGDY